MAPSSAAASPVPEDLIDAGRELMTVGTDDVSAFDGDCIKEYAVDAAMNAQPRSDDVLTDLTLYKWRGPLRYMQGKGG